MHSASHGSHVTQQWHSLPAAGSRESRCWELAAYRAGLHSQSWAGALCPPCERWMELGLSRPKSAGICPHQDELVQVVCC